MAPAFAAGRPLFPCVKIYQNMVTPMTQDLTPKPDYNFRHYVRDEDDLHGMIAYGLYKFQKIRLCDENPQLREKALAEACRKYVMGRQFEANKKEAAERMTRMQDQTIAAFAKSKTRRDWLVGVCSGLVASLVAPILFWALVSLVQASGVTHPLMVVAQAP